MSKQQIIAASGASSANRNSGSQISFINNGQNNKTPVGAQLSTGVTTGSQKHLHLSQQQQNSSNAASQSILIKGNNNSNVNNAKLES